MADKSICVDYRTILMQIMCIDQNRINETLRKIRHVVLEKNSAIKLNGRKNQRSVFSEIKETRKILNTIKGMEYVWSHLKIQRTISAYYDRR